MTESLFLLATQVLQVGLTDHKSEGTFFCSSAVWRNWKKPHYFCCECWNRCHFVSAECDPAEDDSLWCCWVWQGPISLWHQTVSHDRWHSWVPWVDLAGQRWSQDFSLTFRNYSASCVKRRENNSHKEITIPAEFQLFFQLNSQNKTFLILQVILHCGDSKYFWRLFQLCEVLEQADSNCVETIAPERITLHVRKIHLSFA